MTETWFEDLARYVLIAALVVFAATLLFVVITRITRQARTASRDQRITRLRTHMSAILDEEPLPELSNKDCKELTTLVISLSQSVRGEDRAILAAWLRGVDVERRAFDLMNSRIASRRAKGITLYLPLADREPAPLEKLLEDRNRAVRALAARALGRAAALDSLPALLEHTGNGPRSIPEPVAMMAIMRMAPRSANPFFNVLPKVKTDTAAFLVRLVGSLNLIDGRARLEHLLRDPRAEVRLAALGSLGNLGMPTSLRALEDYVPTSEAEEVARRQALADVELSLS
ncbi:HEAT repeat domain-containing protein [Jonesia quinghaiensis]|uniref:HEAT repeat domain-containing protein n=1 Tax=Jonesia quinghaiensis TaxID=262806 RepID=UPI0004224FE1|nr:HEAT repeat domain-containing protein [Jonesia quinghaiensis]